MSKAIEAYREILQAINNNDDIASQDSGIDIRDRLESRIELEEISEEFGINITNKDAQPGRIELSYGISITMMGDDHKRTISWSDDGRQPKNERLLCVGFPTGGYIFGDEYPTKTFNAYFAELCEFGPKYKDSMNHYLYFDSSNSAIVYKAVKELYKKYQGLVKAELEEREIAALEVRLSKLKEASA